jgi:hypothetical protein
MARYRNEEVQVVSYVPLNPEVVIKHYDGSIETVKLSSIVLSRHEMVEFFKSEAGKLKDKQVEDEKRVAHEEKKIAIEKKIIDKQLADEKKLKDAKDKELGIYEETKVVEPKKPEPKPVVAETVSTGFFGKKV